MIMTCPKCQAVAQMKQSSCLACGADLTALQLANQLNTDLKEIRGTLAELQGATEAVLQRHAELEARLRETVAESDESESKESPTLTPALAPIRNMRKQDQARGVGQPSQPEPMPCEAQDPPPIPAAQPLPPLPSSPPPAAKDRPAREALSEVMLGQKGLLIVGIVVLLLGIGYFLKYSFEQGWVKPPVRVLLAYLAGGALLGAGEAFRRTQLAAFGLNLIGGGIATLYFSTYAGFQLYNLIPQIGAFGLMIVITALACAMSLVYNTKWLAVLGLIGGFLTPAILGFGAAQVGSLMSYITILNVGILGISFRKRWSLLTYLGCFGTWLVFTGWMSGYYTAAVFPSAYSFQVIFFLLYAVAPFAYHFVRNRDPELRGFWITFPNAFISFAYSYGMIGELYPVRAISIATLGYTALFLYLATWLLRNRPAARPAFVLMAAKSMVFLGITVPILFDGSWITIFWSLQALSLLWAAARLDNRWLHHGAIVLLALAAVKLFGYDYTHSFGRTSSYPFRPGFTAELIPRWLTELAVLGTAACLARHSQKNRYASTSLFWSLTGLMLFMVLNTETLAASVEYLPEARHAAQSVLWTGFSIALIALGFWRRLPAVRVVALALFALTLLKVFLLDMSQASKPFRIISFLVLGLVLIVTSFLYHKFRHLILPADRESGDDGSRRG